MVNLLHPELSYKIVGILFEVHRELGNRYQEKYYQRAVAKLLAKSGLRCEREVEVALYIHGEPIGKYLVDFIIEGKILLEIKAVPCLKPQDFRQVRSYLRARGLELGILANFRPERLAYKRILHRLDTDN